MPSGRQRDGPGTAPGRPRGGPGADPGGGRLPAGGCRRSVGGLGRRFGGGGGRLLRDCRRGPISWPGAAGSGGRSPGDRSRNGPETGRKPRRQPRRKWAGRRCIGPAIPGLRSAGHSTRFPARFDAPPGAGWCGPPTGPPHRPPAEARAPVAQLDRASDYGSEGWEFESSRARHYFSLRSMLCDDDGGGTSRHGSVVASRVRCYPRGFRACRPGPSRQAVNACAHRRREVHRLQVDAQADRRLIHRAKMPPPVCGGIGASPATDEGGYRAYPPAARCRA